MFGALSARLGVDNVREHMEAHSAQREAAMEQKMTMAKQVRNALAVWSPQKLPHMGKH